MSLAFNDCRRNSGWLLRVVLVVLAFTTGCRVGPDYRRPCPDIADEWIDSQHERLQGEPIDPRYWWTSFQDPVLERLIVSARGENLTVRQAGMRVMEARAQFAIARGDWFPQSQQVQGSYVFTDISANRPNFANVPGFSRSFSNWQLGMAATWELDFWGRFRRSIDAAGAELDATVENYDDVLVILFGDVATTYIDLRTLEQRIDLAKENAEIQRKTLELVKNRLDAGKITELDYKQSETNLRQTEATIPNLERLRRETNNRLCVLLGRPPVDLTPEIGRTARIPIPPPSFALNIPADLLRRRPDIRRAERQLAAQSERIGIAAAEFYPHLGLQGNIGVEAANFSKLFTGDSIGGSVGPTLNWNVLNYGRIRNNVRAQEARFQQLAYAYLNTVLNANAEVENAVVGFIKYHEQRGFLEQSAAASRRATELSVIRYDGGTADFNEVFLLQGIQVGRLDAVAEAQGNVAKSFVGIYRGLGGGWEIRTGGVPPLTPLPPVTEELPSVPAQPEAGSVPPAVDVGPQP
jgi:NodT family efflux transporter outer membrane factor (OMF) lipoprotein